MSSDANPELPDPIVNMTDDAKHRIASMGLPASMKW
jgi:hypothetical protein